ATRCSGSGWRRSRSPGARSHRPRRRWATTAARRADRAAPGRPGRAAGASAAAVRGTVPGRRGRWRPSAAGGPRAPAPLSLSPAREYRVRDGVVEGDVRLHIEDRGAVDEVETFDLQ